MSESSRRSTAWALALAALGLLGASPADDAAGAPAREFLFELPAPGSYALPVIDRVADYDLVAPDGSRTPLLGAPEGSCTLVSFIYRSCIDASGCPLALATLQRVDRAIASRDDLAGRVRLVTVSFDPERDSPEAMASLRHHMRPRGAWDFLTAANERELAPVLVDYGQDAVPLLTRDGRVSGVVRHVAKVFLVDADGGIRNVYSTGFLDDRLLLLDIETLLAPGQ